MKKYTPYVFPLIVISVVFLLVFRWYNLRSDLVEYDLLGEGIEIENLSEEEASRFSQGVADFESVNLEGANPDNSGIVRYEIEGDIVRFSVEANLPESGREYRVWLRSLDGKAMREAFVLSPAKGGYLGNATLPAELLPFEIIVSDLETAREVDENGLLRGVIDSSQAENEVEL
jgi:hypothetical protein